MTPSTISTAPHDWEMAQPLLLQGAPYERGLIHGETLRSQIHEVVGRWKGEVAHMSIFARYGDTDFRPRRATRRDGAPKPWNCLCGL